MAREMRLSKNKFIMSDEIETIIEKTVTKFGTGAKLDCPKEYLDKKAYILIRKS